MINNLTVSLLITALGMGLVFGAILLFWLFMSVLVRLVSGTGAEEKVEREAAAVDAVVMSRLASRESDLRRRAALAAALAAVALAEQEEGPGRFPLPPTALVSSWQAVMRARQLAERGEGR